MRPWLSVLLKHLEDGNKVVLAVESLENLSMAAVFNANGLLLGGNLLSKDSLHAASEKILSLSDDKKIAWELKENNWLTLEIIEPLEQLDFWLKADIYENRSWAAWLVTIINKASPSYFVRHLIGSFGNSGAPVSTDGYYSWQLLPLNPGLGKLFVFGEDQLSLDAALLAAKTGINTVLITLNPHETAELTEKVDSLLISSHASWDDVNEELLLSLGFKEGVMAILGLSVPMAIKELLISYKIFYKDANPDAEKEKAGLFPKAHSNFQKALGLVAAILLK